MNLPVMTGELSVPSGIRKVLFFYFAYDFVESLKHLPSKRSHFFFKFLIELLVKFLIEFLVKYPFYCLLDDELKFSLGGENIHERLDILFPKHSRIVARPYCFANELFRHALGFFELYGKEFGHAVGAHGYPV